MQGNMCNCFDCFDYKVVILCGRESETPAKHNKTTEEDDGNGNNQRCGKDGRGIDFNGFACIQQPGTGDGGNER